jgi:hypothetical protein
MPSCMAPFSLTLDISFSDFYPSDPSGINLSSEEDEPPLQKSKSRAPENEWQIKSSLSHRTPGNTQALSSPAQPPTL